MIPKWFAIPAVILAVALSSCGGEATQSEEPVIVTSKIAKRVFALNQFFGQIQIIDGATDQPTTFTISTPASPSMMVKAGGRTLVYDATLNRVTRVDNATESTTGTLTLPAVAVDLVASSDGKTAYLAMRNAGSVAVVDLDAGSVTTVDGIPAVSRLVLSSNGAKLLAFSDDSDSLTVINTSDRAKTTVGGFDRAFTAVINADASRAFVLSCGAQCGGTQAKVTVLNLADNTLGASVNVSGATVGLLDGSSLYVAGNPTNAGGLLDVVDASSLTVRKSGVAISDGLHRLMALTGTKLFIGAQTCTNQARSCLSVFDTSAQTATVGNTFRGDVASIEPIKGRNVVYVVEGGDLRIYDSATGALTAQQMQITGRIVKAIEIDQ